MFCHFEFFKIVNFEKYREVLKTGPFIDFIQKCKKNLFIIEVVLAMLFLMNLNVLMVYIIECSLHLQKSKNRSDVYKLDI